MRPSEDVRNENNIFIVVILMKSYHVRGSIFKAYACKPKVDIQKRYTGRDPIPRVSVRLGKKLQIDLSPVLGITC